jgi:pimeloyl-ACP methyl ester carboxylesterase
MTAAVHTTVWNDSDDRAASVILIHGTMTWCTACCEKQRPLADRYRLIVLDRRGFGSSPDIDHSDYEVDAIDVLDVLDAGSAHVVGHSYGGVVAMLAAARRHDRVLSLTLIEPAALRCAEADPTVSMTLRRLRQAVANVPQSVTPTEYLRLSTEITGKTMPKMTPPMERPELQSKSVRNRWTPSAGGRWCSAVDPTPRRQWALAGSTAMVSCATVRLRRGR